MKNTQNQTSVVKNLDETLNILEYGLRDYRRAEHKRNFDLLDYYAFFDQKPSELAKTVAELGRKSLSVCLRTFEEFYYYSTSAFREERIAAFKYGNKDLTLTQDEKVLIYNTLTDLGYPLIEGVFISACRRYLNEGSIEVIEKSNVRKRIIENYKNGDGQVVKQNVKKI